MDYTRRFALFSVATVCASTALHATPVTIKGAMLDAPAACEVAGGALVCKLDGQQFELWITRKPLAANMARGDTMARKMLYFSEIHEMAVNSIAQSTANDKVTPFSVYGSYSALGSAMPGNGVPKSPAVRFAQVLHDEEIWEFLEVVATRTPAIDSLADALQRSLKLPSIAPVPLAATNARPEPTKAAAASTPSMVADDIRALAPTTTEPRFSGPLLSMQYPDFLEPVVIENTVTRFAVNFKHKHRAGGPNLMVSLRAPKDKTETAAAVVKARKDALTATMTGESGSVEVNTLGDIKGTGFAMIGVPDAKKGLSGVESIETTFAADLTQGLLEVRLGSEQKYATDTRAVWSLLVKSITPAK